MGAVAQLGRAVARAVPRSFVGVVWFDAWIGVVPAVPATMKHADDAGVDEGEARAVG